MRTDAVTKNRLTDSSLRQEDNYSTGVYRIYIVYYAEASANCRRVRFAQLPADATINRQADTHHAHVLVYHAYNFNKNSTDRAINEQ